MSSSVKLFLDGHLERKSVFKTSGERQLDLVFEEPFKILLVMADQVVLRLVDENDFEKQGKWYLCERYGKQTSFQKPIYK